MIKRILKKLLNRDDLTQAEIKKFMVYLNNYYSDSLAASFISLLTAKGETTDEIIGIVTAMRQLMLSINTKDDVLDIVGTGGDEYNTVNISTAAALVAAASGVKIAKHGNRAVSSLCGSADVLEAFGLELDLAPRDIEACLNSHNFAFCYAVNFHPFMAKIRKIRKLLGFSSIFNIIGPLLNPCHANHIILGVARIELMESMASLLMKLGIKRALVVHGNGLDELSTVGTCNVIEINFNACKSYDLKPSDFGFSMCRHSDLEGGTPHLNAKIIREVFRGETSAVTDTILLNAGAAIYLYGLAPTIASGIDMAKEKLNDGSCLKILKDVKSVSKQSIGSCHA